MNDGRHGNFQCAATFEASAFDSGVVAWKHGPPAPKRVTLRCHLSAPHEGPHERLLPVEAGVDAGKLYCWLQSR